MTDCLFCGIVAEKIKANVVFKNDYVVVFKDINPKAPVHLLIIPRKHIAGVLDIEPEGRRDHRRDFSSRRSACPRSRHCRKRLSGGG
jgi:Diadenosine tetraphosphate (Ap4A) hydrolase and other HIT family hydrolases